MSAFSGLFLLSPLKAGICGDRDDRFFKPGGQFGRFSSQSEDDKTRLNVASAVNRFIKVTEVGFTGFVEDDGNVMVQIEFVGEISEQARYRFELRALDERDNVVVSSMARASRHPTGYARKERVGICKEIWKNVSPVLCYQF